VRAIAALVARELRLGLAGLGLTVIFFVLVAVLFPFALGPGAALLRRIAPAVLWVAALLAALLPVERLVAPDREAGVLDQLVARGVAEETVALAKLIAHWLAFGPAIMLATLPAAAMFDLAGPVLARLELALLIGTPGLAALGVAVAALTAASRRASAIAGLLLLPLAVPVLIFGSATAAGEPGALGLLAAASLLLVGGSPFAAGAAMRAARD
jgi:heme exporter protein B